MGAGPGRPKGSTNKLTKQLKDMVLGALDAAGGEEYLAKQARENPKAFLSLLGRVLPIDTRLSGPNGEPLPPGQAVAPVINVTVKRN